MAKMRDVWYELLDILNISGRGHKRLYGKHVKSSATQTSLEEQTFTMTLGDVTSLGIRPCEEDTGYTITSLIQLNDDKGTACLTLIHVPKNKSLRKSVLGRYPDLAYALLLGTDASGLSALPADEMNRVNVGEMKGVSYECLPVIRGIEIMSVLNSFPQKGLKAFSLKAPTKESGYVAVLSLSL